MVIWNDGDFDRIHDFVTPDFVGHDPIMEEMRGSRALIKQIRDIQRDFPDAEYRIEDIVAEGDRVVTRWSVVGTHRFVRKRVALTGLTMARLEGGRIAESWIERDSAVLLTALAPTDVLAALFGWVKHLRP